VRLCEIEEKSSFRRDFRKLSQEVKMRVKEIVDLLKRNPYAGRPLKGKLKKFWRYRVGKYRIIYLPQPCHVTLVFIRHRETVYF